MNEQKMRDAFEAWHLNYYKEHADDNGAVDHTRWIAYQAATSTHTDLLERCLETLDDVTCDLMDALTSSSEGCTPEEAADTMDYIFKMMEQLKAALGEK